MSAVTLVILGLIGLIAGGELLVRGAVAAARRFGISPMVIGLTLVGFGTSTPELVTSLQAALAGSPGIAMGNVVGSNIGNILLILGLAGVIAPVVVDPAALRRDGSMMLFATGICLCAVLWGAIGRGAGFGMFAVLVVYLAAVLVWEKRAGDAPSGAVYEGEADVVGEVPAGIWASVALALGGLVLTILGARFLVSGAVSLAQAAGISQTVIGLTIVAIGTSMPELVTTVIAMRKGQGEVALGNVLGSNIFNILAILGITSMVQPLAVPPEIIGLDVWVMVAASVALVVFARTGWRIGRGEGAVMLACYGGYVGWLLL
ncbi:calcium/sodium antiporter [Alphaproteobacteria bacterium KMM 3653]|uniref:Calcium/sodium antiporter n=1 Tax=Harenicola maris TaxID=2841044 RepID=A0AAP2CLQ0_9RHOB|nr:calcium/sodium antiporter [Harenicola maris]